MRMNAYVHGSGGKVSDIVAATRQGMSPPSIYTATPEMTEARDRRVIGVQCTPASVGHAVIYPLDNESRANLSNLYFSTYIGGPFTDPELKLPVIDNGMFSMVMFTTQEIQQLGSWALLYTYRLYDHADKLHKGEIPPDTPWPSNDYNASERHA